MKKRKSPYNKKRLFKKIKLLLIIFIVLYIIIFVFLDIQKRLLLATDELTKIKGQSIINETINKSINDIISNKNLNSEDFYYTNLNEKGEIITIDVNTVLINEICNYLSDSILKSFENKNITCFQIPFLSLYNSTFFNQTGPLVKISLIPVGNVLVVPNTSFTSAGINQTNFEVSLDIEVTMQMTNPISKEIVLEKRHMPLVNTVINGSVPSYTSTNSN